MQTSEYKKDKHSDHAMSFVPGKRSIAAAILFSLGVHFLFMTAVNVITPENLFRTQPFTSVRFLGPILEKTAFDIMIGDKAAGGPGGGILDPVYPADDHMSLSPGTIKASSINFPSYGRNEIYGIVRADLFGELRPDMRLGGSAADRSPGKAYSGMADGRSVVFRPSPPVVPRGAYGGSEYFKVVLEGTVEMSGEVKETVVEETSGYSFIDMEALKYFRKWRFEPAEGSLPEKQRIKVPITVYTITDGS